MELKRITLEDTGERRIPRDGEPYLYCPSGRVFGPFTAIVPGFGGSPEAYVILRVVQNDWERASREATEVAIAKHYSNKFQGNVRCIWDGERGQYCIRGEGLTPHPALATMYPNGWSMLDYLDEAKVEEILMEGE